MTIFSFYLLIRKSITPEDCSDDSNSNLDANPSKRPKKDFFYSLKEKDPRETAELDQYLNEGPSDTNSLIKYPKILKMYLRYNTALPSSASVERLFSCGGQIFRPTRSKLSDHNFEMLLFLKSNSNI